MFRKEIGSYCENCKKCIDMLCGQNTEFWYVKTAGTYRTSGLQGLRWCPVVEFVINSVEISCSMSFYLFDQFVNRSVNQLANESFGLV
jgi:hypothetical protein